MQATSSTPTPSSGWPPTDLLGRAQPHGFSWITWFRAFPFLIEFFDQDVPDDFWTVESYADGLRVMSVACPCGETPSVPETKCVECDCGRFYLNLGERIKVARPEDVPAAVPDKASE